VFASGTKVVGEHVVMFSAVGGNGVAFVSGRRLGSAVVRNRARRVLRAAWREASSQVQLDRNIVLVARSPISRAGSNPLIPELVELLRRSEGVSS
jgi:ribonuclease P protein component